MPVFRHGHCGRPSSVQRRIRLSDGSGTGLPPSTTTPPPFEVRSPRGRPPRRGSARRRAVTLGPPPAPPRSLDDSVLDMSRRVGRFRLPISAYRVGYSPGCRALVFVSGTEAARLPEPWIRSGRVRLFSDPRWRLPVSNPETLTPLLSPTGFSRRMQCPPERSSRQSSQLGSLPPPS